MKGTRICTKHVAILGLLLHCAVANAADFTLVEHLGHTWTNERVTFGLSEAQKKCVAKGLSLVDSKGNEVAWQMLGERSTIAFVTDLGPYETRTFSFSDKKAVKTSDLRVTESDGELRVTNGRTGLVVRRKLKGAEGPIASVRLPSGTWTGDSALAGAGAISRYAASVTERGPVSVEITCKAAFADGGTWEMRFRIDRNEPVILVSETFDVPGGGRFDVALGSADFTPAKLLFRAGKHPQFGNVMSAAVPAAGTAFELEPWLHWWYAVKRGNWFALYTPGANAPDMLIAGVLRPSTWKDPRWTGKAPRAKAYVRAVSNTGVVTLQFPLAGGRRAWMLGGLGKAGSVEVLEQKNRRVAPPPQRYLIKHGDLPLDEVKDYILHWTGDHDNYPRLFVGRDQLKQMRKTLKSDPKELRRWESQQPINKYNIGGPLREYFASGSERLGDKIAARTEQWLDVVVGEDLLRQNSRVTLGVAPHSQAVLLLPTLNLTDTALATKNLTPERRRRILAKIAFLGYVVSRDDYWAPKFGFSANPNMTTTVAQYQVTTASLIPSHPMAKTWAGRGLRELYSQLTSWSDQDGGWLEAPHYAMASFDHMLGAFIMARRAGFADLIYHERVRKVIEWFARISTPPDPHTGGFRHLPPIGNTYHGEATGMFGIVAGLWKDRAPEFAAHMQWMCEQHGSPDMGLGWSFPTMTGYKRLLKAHGIKPKRPDYGSSWFRKTGVVLRGRLGTDRETYLHLIAGTNHEHYDYDSGSIILWGKGRVLADDWGYIGRHAPKYHSMLTSSATGRGVMRVTAFSTQPALDYVNGRKGAWQRQIAFLKDTDPLAGNVFLLRDTHDADAAGTWRLWLTAQSVKVHKNGATIVGKDDVDMDVFVYDAARFKLGTESARQKMSVGNRGGKVGPMTMTQTALTATLPGRSALIALLCPRLRSQAPVTVEWHADGRIAEMTSKTGTDYVFLAPTAQSATAEKVSFKGTAGAVRVRGKAATMALGAAGEARMGEKKLTSDTATSRTHP